MKILGVSGDPLYNSNTGRALKVALSALSRYWETSPVSNAAMETNEATVQVGMFEYDYIKDEKAETVEQYEKMISEAIKSFMEKIMKDKE